MVVPAHLEPLPEEGVGISIKVPLHAADPINKQTQMSGVDVRVSTVDVP